MSLVKIAYLVLQMPKQGYFTCFGKCHKSLVAKHVTLYQIINKANKALSVFLLKKNKSSNIKSSKIKSSNILSSNTEFKY